MIFEVMRTTTGRDKKPIENCFPIKLVSTANGKEMDCWGIRIKTLKELIDFQNQVEEEIVFRKSWVDEKTFCLEIYDGYRE